MGDKVMTAVVKQLNEDRYGVFVSSAILSQEIKKVMHSGFSFDSLKADKKEALEEIANRISRIVNGNPDEKRPWEEIRNYANLVLGV